MNVVLTLGGHDGTASEPIRALLSRSRTELEIVVLIITAAPESTHANKMHVAAIP